MIGIQFEFCLQLIFPKEIFILVSFRHGGKGKVPGGLGHVRVCFEQKIEDFVTLRTTVSLLNDLQLPALVNCGSRAAVSVRYHVHNSWPLETFLKYVNPVQGLTFSVLNICDEIF